MLIGSPTQNPEIQRRQALARVYALLIRLADDKESVRGEAVDGGVEGPKEVANEVQRKNSKRAKSPPRPGKQRK